MQVKIIELQSKQAVSNLPIMDTAWIIVTCTHSKALNTLEYNNVFICIFRPTCTLYCSVQ